MVKVNRQTALLLCQLSSGRLRPSAPPLRWVILGSYGELYNPYMGNLLHRDYCCNCCNGYPIVLEKLPNRKCFQQKLFNHFPEYYERFWVTLTPFSCVLIICHLWFNDMTYLAITQTSRLRAAKWLSTVWWLTAAALARWKCFQTRQLNDTFMKIYTQHRWKDFVLSEVLAAVPDNIPISTQK